MTSSITRSNSDPFKRESSNLSGSGSNGTPPIQREDELGSTSDQLFFVTSYR